MSTKTVAESFAELRELKDRAFAALEGADIPRIAETISLAGYDSYRGGRGLLEILVRRHRSERHRPLIPEVSQSDVVQLADELGLSPQFEPARRLDL